jgi:hypothetical protein
MDLVEHLSLEGEEVPRLYNLLSTIMGLMHEIRIGLYYLVEHLALEGE